MDLDKLNRAKEIQRQLTQIQGYIDHFPDLDTWDFIGVLLAEDFGDYKDKALWTLHSKARLLEVEFSEL